MPPPSDPWATPGPGPGGGSGRGRGWLFAIGVVSALVLTGIVATVVVLATRTPGTPSAAAPAATRSAGPRAFPASGSPSPTPSPSPTASPTVAPPTSSTSPTAAPQQPLPTASTTPTVAPGPDRSLKTNALYGVDLDKASDSCDLKVRRPKPPLANKKLQPYLTEVVGCLTSVFKAPLAAEGFTLVEPKVKTYHERVESPCGDFGQSGSPAYYCSTTSTIYWPDTVDDGREAYTFARLGYVGLTAHEFGHHLQATTGMLNGYAGAHKKASTKEGYALSRRLELQAQCFEGVFLHATAKELDVSSQDRQELKAWHSYTGDEDPPDDRKPDHGSSEAQFAWLDRGLQSGDFADCNTWTASSTSVS
ncbi:MAG: neutral zinc metallopeptidase [Janthinobacterium lividum]